MKKRRFSAEFKKDAARMLILEGVRATELSDQLGVHPSLLYDWKNKYLEELDSGAREGERSPRAMAAEIEDLRKQLAKSQRMNQILKKTVSFFSKDDE